MTHLLAQVRLQSDSLLPRDVVVNTFHAATSANIAAAAAEWAADLDAFYQAIDIQFGATLAATGHVIHFYDQETAPPRVPVLIFPMTAMGIGGSQLPREVALCMSFKGSSQAGDIAPRHRGRIYLGPLSGPSDTLGRPSAAFTDALRDAGQGLLDASQAATDYTWGVYSTVDNALYEVVEGWVDNEWDTVRSRGQRPTTRDVFN